MRHMMAHCNREESMPSAGREHAAERLAVVCASLPSISFRAHDGILSSRAGHGGADMNQRFKTFDTNVSAAPRCDDTLRPCSHRPRRARSNDRRAFIADGRREAIEEYLPPEL
jgi:hypothetical protein